MSRTLLRIPWFTHVSKCWISRDSQDPVSAVQCFDTTTLRYASSSRGRGGRRASDGKGADKDALRWQPLTDGHEA